LKRRSFLGAWAASTLPTTVLAQPARDPRDPTPSERGAMADLAGDLDRLVWNMVRKVRDWSV
jgi:hypothetical protein